MKILIVHHDNFTRQTLRAYLINSIVDQATIIETGIANEVLELCNKNLFDVIIISYLFDKNQGIELLNRLNKTNQAAKKILLSPNVNILNLRQVLRLKCSIIDTSSEKIMRLSNLITSSQEGIYLSPSIQLAANNDLIKFREGDSIFSQTELKVIHYICADYSSEEMSEMLNRSKRTIDGIRLKINQKIGTRGVAGIVTFAIKNGYYEV